MKPQYIISTGVTSLLENRYNLALSDGACERIRGLEYQFAERLGEELSEAFDYRIVTEEDIEKRMDEALRKRPGMPVINLDDVYFQNKKNDGSISITRLVQDINNFDNKVLGPRKGYQSVEDQIENIQNQYSGQFVAIMDVGVFSGETLLDEEKGGLVSLLRKNGIAVPRLYVSIMNEPARERFGKEGVEVISGGEDFDFTNGDWLEVRDLLGLDGRKIDCASYDINSNTQLFARYIQDPETLAKGANITDGVQAAIVLDLCNMYQKKIMREVRKEGYQVIEGFINSDPRLYTLEFRK